MARFKYPTLLLMVIIIMLFSINHWDISEWLKPGFSHRTKTEEKKPNDWFYVQRSFPEKSLDFRAWQLAQEQASSFRVAAKADNIYWTPAGPTNIGGRITAVTAHPTQPNTIWVGAADGGVWKSGNGGGEWVPVFDFAPSLSIGALAIDPNDPATVYVGTGEANSSGDSYPGNGIYRTTDAGLSWQYLGLPQSYYIGRIAINSQNSNNIFVAATGLLFGKNPERGIYRTIDGGSNWQKVFYISDSTAGIDVVIHPTNPDTVYAAMWERIRRPWERKAGGITSGIYRSIDGGTTWNPLSNGLPPASQTVGRIGLGISASSPNILYAIYADHPGYFMGLYKSIDDGQSWTRVNDGSLSNLFSSFGWYFGQVYVDPTNPNVVYALGVDLFKSNNGGNSWSSIAGGTHVDHHAVWADPSNPSRVILGNDGGLFISGNGGSSFSKVLNLPLSQFYAATVDYNNPYRLYGGTQDNGTLRTMSGYSNEWERIYGGDGFYVIVDPTNSNIIYAEYQYGGLGKSTNGGLYFSSATSGINSGDRRNWMVPVVMDPNNSNTLYYGTYRLYKTTNAAGNWNPISQDLSNGPYSGGLSFGTITTIAVSPLTSNQIWVGTDDGNVWVSNNNGNTWNKVSAGLPSRWVTRLVCDPFDANSALVTYSGYKYNSYIGYIFKTNNLGQTWINITANLPQAPINVVVADPAYSGVYYVGTDVGVFYTTNSGSIWNMLGSNLPNSVVMDLVLHQPTRQLVAATHGRSMYKADISNILNLADNTKAGLEDSYYLAQNYPNPFNSITNLHFYLPDADEISLRIFNLLGKQVFKIASGHLNAGWHHVSWNARTDRGKELPSGTYLVQLKAGNKLLTRKIILLK